MEIGSIPMGSTICILLVLYVIGVMIILLQPPYFSDEEKKVMMDAINQQFHVDWAKRLIITSKLRNFID